MNTIDLLKNEIAQLRQRVADLEQENTELTARVQACTTELDRMHRSLHTNQSLLQNITDHMPAAMFVKDLDGYYLLVNEYTASLLHYTPEQIVGRTDADLFPPEIATAWHEQDQTILTTGQTMTVEQTAVLPDGPHTFLSTKFPIRDAHGHIDGIAGISTDITERLQAEETYRTLVHNSLQGLTIYQDDRIVFANPAAAQFVGYTVPELLAMPPQAVSRLFHPKDRRMIQKRARARLNGQNVPQQYQARMLRKDGTLCWVAIFSTRIIYQGKPAIHSVCVDITEQKQAEEQLQRHDAILQAIAHSIERFLRNHNLGEIIQVVLQRLGQASEASRVYIFENRQHADGTIGVIQSYQWAETNTTTSVDNLFPHDLSYQRDGFERWERLLSQNQPITGAVRFFPATERGMLDAQDILSIAVVPIFVRQQWWGFIGFDDCTQERVWLPSEIDILRTAAGLLGAAIQQQQDAQSLRENQALLQSILDHAPASIYVKDHQGHALLHNHPVADYYGLTPDQVVANTTTTVEYSTITQLCRAYDQQVLTTGKPLQHEMAVPLDDGEHILSATKFPILNDAGDVIAVGGIIIDITQQKHAEEAYRTLVDNSLQGYLIIQDEIIVFTNPASFKITGYSTDEVLAMSPEEIFNIVHPDDRVLPAQYLQERQAGKSVDHPYEYRVFHKTGELLWLEVFIVETTYRGRDASQVTYIDITERKWAEERLRENQALLQALLDYSPNTIFVKDLQRNLLIANWHLAKLVHRHPDEIIGHTEDEFYPIEQIQLWQQEDQRIIETGLPLDVEEGLKVPDGSLHTYLFTKFPIRNPEGAVWAIGGIATDITERKQAEEHIRHLNADLEQRVTRRTQELMTTNQTLLDEIAERQRVEAALRESEAFSRAVLNSVRAYIVVVDQAGLVQASNNIPLLPTYCAAARALLAPTIGTDYLQSHVDTDAFSATVQNIQAGIRRVRDGSQTIFNLEYRCPTAQCNHWWTLSVAALNTRQGEVVVSHFDITKRKQAEERLAHAYVQLEELNRDVSRSNALLRTLFNGLPDGLLLLDHTGTVLAVNQTFADLLNEPIAALEDRTWEHICQHMGIAATEAWQLNPFAEKHSHCLREHYTDLHGHSHLLDIHILPLRDIDQHRSTTTIPSRVIIHVVDVTERLRLEALLLKNERLAAKGKLAATVAHGINTPLQSIQTALYLLNQVSDHERAAFLQVVDEEIDRIKQILSQLLEVYRPKNTFVEQVQMNTIIKRVLLLMHSLFDQHGIVVVQHLQSDLPACTGHVDQLTQVLFDLFLNALEAMPDGGQLEVRTAPRSSDAMLIGSAALIVTITDTGIGIAPEIQAHIFDPFFTTKQTGTGLGLFNSQTIVAQHGGIIRVESPPDAGSTFTIVLPVVTTEE